MTKVVAFSAFQLVDTHRSLLLVGPSRSTLPCLALAGGEAKPPAIPLSRLSSSSVSCITSSLFVFMAEPSVLGSWLCEPTHLGWVDQARAFRTGHPRIRA